MSEGSDSVPFKLIYKMEFSNVLARTHFFSMIDPINEMNRWNWIFVDLYNNNRKT